MLSFNVKDATAHASTLAALVQHHRVDVLVLQEVRRPIRAAFSSGLAGFYFVWGDKKVRFEHEGQGLFSSMIGVLRSAHISVQAVATGITGYRTFVVKLSREDQSFWVVNVHTTKAFWLQGSLVDTFRKAQYKSAWHVMERKQLGKWLAHNQDLPVLVSGDFNVPAGVYNTRYQDFTHAII